MVNHEENMKLGPSEMVLKYCDVSTFPHHLMTYSWGTQHKARPVYHSVAAGSLLTVTWARRHARVQPFLQLLWLQSFFARPLMHTCLVIVQNIHQTIRQSNYARIQQLSFWKPSHLRSLCTSWACSKAPASPFMSHESKMSRHISSKKSDSD